ncbi:hypothetical protein [Embleya sp. NBC_00896]|uniref:hypothetical protein n=1 Tax=Embleya sp. NBC_00896 TaxID=2975961 RepID=UPI002F9161E5|nr:hypothetical protein OG928_33060 [Embleya sp. NBC_00896]
MGATYLDDRIREGTVVVVDGDGPDARAMLLPIAQFADSLTDDRDHGHPQDHKEVCPRLHCHGNVHLPEEHKVWVHLHHLHTAGRLLLNDNDAVRLAVPPREPGERRAFVSWHGPAGTVGEESVGILGDRTQRLDVRREGMAAAGGE